MKTYRLDLSYVGTNFSGWQIQPNGRSIQEELQKALKVICRGETIRVIGSGRTDAGVHALNQVAHFRCAADLEGKHLQSLNGLLPQEIRVKGLKLVENDFHAQISAKKKMYRYHVYRNRTENPFNAPYHWHLFDSLSLEKMKQAAALFVGTHDFTTFANQANCGAAAKNGVRTLYSVTVEEVGDHLTFEFVGNGFLYKMVRNIVGTLIDVGRGKVQIEEILTFFEQKDRRLASQAAPAQGLFLVSVTYN